MNGLELQFLFTRVKKEANLGQLYGSYNQRKFLIFWLLLLACVYLLHYLNFDNHSFQTHSKTREVKMILSHGSRKSLRGTNLPGGGTNSRHGCFTKTLYIETKESGLTNEGGGASAVPPEPASYIYFSRIKHKQYYDIYIKFIPNLLQKRYYELNMKHEQYFHALK